VIVAITGRTGFIGKSLSHAWSSACDTVRLLTRTPAVSENSPLLQIHDCDLVMVGTNSKIEREVVDGFLESSDQEWVSTLTGLHADRAFLLEMGREGRLRIVS